MTVDEYSKAEEVFKEIKRAEELIEKVKYSKANDMIINIILNHEQEEEATFTTDLSSPLGNYIYDHLLRNLEKYLNRNKDIFNSL